MNWAIFSANLIVFVHVLFVGFVVLSVPTILVGRYFHWNWVRNFWFRLVHLLLMAIVIIETVSDFPCPLTVWERDLRLIGGQLHQARYDDGELKTNDDGEPLLKANREYQNDFVGRLLHRIIFLEFEVLTPELLNTCYYVFGSLVLATYILVPPSWPSRKRRLTPLPVPDA